MYSPPTHELSVKIDPYFNFCVWAVIRPFDSISKIDPYLNFSVGAEYSGSFPNNTWIIPLPWMYSQSVIKIVMNKDKPLGQSQENEFCFKYDVC